MLKIVWFLMGSPPRVQGKVHGCADEGQKAGITPAYAGKRTDMALGSLHGRDHPRVCGEKIRFLFHLLQEMGSPPRMRGKALVLAAEKVKFGITPAYAGKRCPRDRGAGQNQDHPRVCGEKFGMIGVIWPVSGSPPRVRGKGTDGAAEHGLYGITPAYAGKSRFAVRSSG